MVLKESGETLINLPSNETDLLSEEKNAKRLAEILRLPFVDLKELSIQTEILATIPSELYSRYSFIPVSDEGDRITIVTADPTNVKMLDDIEAHVKKPLNVLVGLKSQIQEVLKKTEAEQKVLDEVSEDLKLQIVREDTEEGEEVVSLEKLSSDTSPIVKLVDFTVYNALQKRASDIHIETGDIEVQIKYRVDGVLYP
ncbi:MAG: pilus assembly protein PilB, partial [Acidobacteria bacterium]|nr:pilus assembly protein PilB [Acidobacteriota bacterium]